jgi:hypothetical protein
MTKLKGNKTLIKESRTKIRKISKTKEDQLTFFRGGKRKEKEEKKGFLATSYQLMTHTLSAERGRGRTT